MTPTTTESTTTEPTPTRPTLDQTWALTELRRALAIGEALTGTQDPTRVHVLADLLRDVWQDCQAVEVTAWVGDTPRVMVEDSTPEEGLAGTFLWDAALGRFRFENIDPDESSPNSAGRFQAECLWAAAIGGPS